MNPLPIFPEELKELETLIRSTIKPYIHLSLLPATEPLSVFTSKVGGDPFWVADEPYLTDSMGYPMPLLAQINFEEMPPLEDFPTEGILQFYITVMDGDSGLNDYREVNGQVPNVLVQKDFRVRYWEKEELDSMRIENFSFIDETNFKPQKIDPITGLDFPYSPVQPLGTCFKLDGIMKSSHVNFNDMLFKEIEKQFPPNLETLIPNYFDYFCEDVYSSIHRIGGYPVFTQDDLRMYIKQIKDFILLFQLGSQCIEKEQTTYEIQWGDWGVGMFFIHPDDLKNGNFDRVFYTWDCG